MVHLLVRSYSRVEYDGSMRSAALLALVTGGCSLAEVRAPPKKPPLTAAALSCPVAPVITDAVLGGALLALGTFVVSIDDCIDACNNDKGRFLIASPLLIGSAVALASATYGAVESDQCYELQQRFVQQRAGVALANADAVRARTARARVREAAANQCDRIEVLALEALAAGPDDSAFLFEPEVAECIRGIVRARERCRAERVALFTRAAASTEAASRTELLPSVPTCSEPPPGIGALAAVRSAPAGRSQPDGPTDASPSNLDSEAPSSTEEVAPDGGLGSGNSPAAAEEKSTNALSPAAEPALDTEPATAPQPAEVAVAAARHDDATSNAPRASPLAYVAVGGAFSIDGKHSYMYRAGGINTALAIDAGGHLALPIWAHANIELGTSHPHASDVSGRFFRVRGGPELALCGAVHCGVIGIDFGYQRQGSDIGNTIAAADGPIINPHLSAQIGSSSWRFYLVWDLYFYDLHTEGISTWTHGSGVRMLIARRFSISRGRNGMASPQSPATSPWSTLLDAALAATRGECDRALQLGEQLQRIDSELHATLLSRDLLFGACAERRVQTDRDAYRACLTRRSELLRAAQDQPDPQLRTKLLLDAPTCQPPK